jgi:hypothetical protein
MTQAPAEGLVHVRLDPEPVVSAAVTDPTTSNAIDQATGEAA